MKTIKLLFAAAAMVLSMAACEKNVGIESESEEPETSGKLVSAQLISEESLTDMVNSNLAKVKSSGDWSAVELTAIDQAPNVLYGIIDMFIKDLDAEDRASIPDFGLKVKTWRIEYKTLGGFENKEEVTMTADVAYITDKYDRLSRKLESVSVYNCNINIAAGDLTYFRDLIIPMRAAHNALVVYPFYQGIGCDLGKHVVAPGEYLAKGRQAIDAEIAALELIASLKEEGKEDVEMMDGYYTEIMGSSNGGGATLAMQYLLETDPQMKEINESIINLKGSFIGDGCLSVRNIFPLLMTEVECPDSMGESMLSVDAVKPGTYLTIVVSSYMTWRKGNYTSNVGEDRELLDSYFDSSFLHKEYYNRDCNYIDAFIKGYYYWGIYWDFDDFTIGDVVNKNLLDQNGALNKEDDRMKTLDGFFAKNEVMLSGWSPKATLKIKHSTADEFIPIEYTREWYNSLSEGGTNENVIFEEVNIGTGHVTSAILCMLVDIMIKKHPQSADFPQWWYKLEK